MIKFREETVCAGRDCSPSPGGRMGVTAVTPESAGRPPLLGKATGAKRQGARDSIFSVPGREEEDRPLWAWVRSCTVRVGLTWWCFRIPGLGLGRIQVQIGSRLTRFIRPRSGLGRA